jgi:hypothetical protein
MENKVKLLHRDMQLMRTNCYNYFIDKSRSSRIDALLRLVAGTPFEDNQAIDSPIFMLPEAR